MTFFTIKKEPLSIVKYILILKTQDVFENTRCLDLSNATVLSLFAMLCDPPAINLLLNICITVYNVYIADFSCIYISNNFF